MKNLTLTTLSIALLFTCSVRAMELNTAPQDTQAKLDPAWELAKLSHLQKADSKDLQVTGFGQMYTDPKTLATLHQALLESLRSVSLDQPDETSPDTLVKIDITKLLSLVNVVEGIRQEAIRRDIAAFDQECMTNLLGACVEAQQREQDTYLERTTGEYVQSIAVDLKTQDARICVGFDC